jgi:hypothetical protein
MKQLRSRTLRLGYVKDTIPNSVMSKEMFLSQIVTANAQIEESSGRQKKTTTEGQPPPLIKESRCEQIKKEETLCLK